MAAVSTGLGKRILKICGVLFLIFFAFRIGQFALYMSAESKKKQAMEEKIKVATEKRVAEFNAMTPLEHLEAAKKVGNNPLADKHLQEVPEGYSGKAAIVASLKNERDQLAAIEKRKADADKRKEDAENDKIIAQWKHEGVSIGMTADRVRLSSWGNPESVNRTRNALGDHEQWVYSGSHRYLYFDNGILTTIQD